MILFIYFIIVCVYLYMHMYNFLCSDSLLYILLSFSFYYSVYTRDCSLSNDKADSHYKLNVTQRV